MVSNRVRVSPARREKASPCGEAPARFHCSILSVLVAFAAVLAVVAMPLPASAQNGGPCFSLPGSGAEVMWGDLRGTPQEADALQGALLALSYASDPGSAPPFVQAISDPPNDAKIRRTDLGGVGLVDPSTHTLPDLWSYVIGRWAPLDATLDLFTGDYADLGEFFRLDLVLDGFLTPPGPSEFSGDVSVPFQYGDHPIFGIVEIDMDANINTGGEIAFPQYRYLGNVARFGGLPWARPQLAQRAATSNQDFNTTFGPIHRSGEEFHWALFGGLFWQIDIVAGNADELFEPGEVWDLTGDFFHRAHGYENFSLAAGGPVPGAYAPVSRVRFTHLPAEHTTVVTLVFPLTNEGAAQADADGTVEPLDGDPSNQASVLEALVELVESADYFNNIAPTGAPEQAIIDEWLNQNAWDYLDPTAWPSSVELATSYAVPATTSMFELVWTDLLPNVIPGDFDFDGWVGIADHNALQVFLAFADGSPLDGDGVANGVFVIADFAINFNLFDVDYDGEVDGLDCRAMARTGDLNQDCRIDLDDFATFARCFWAIEDVPNAACDPLEFRRSDMNRSGVVDLVDFATFAVAFTG